MGQASGSVSPCPTRSVWRRPERTYCRVRGVDVPRGVSEWEVVGGQVGCVSDLRRDPVSDTPRTSVLPLV